MDLIYKSKTLAKLILSTVPSEYVFKKGEKNALALFERSARENSSYADFLNESNFDPSHVSSIGSFKDVPAMDKDNYINKYDSNTLLKRTNPYLIYRSSGYTGKPTYWTQDTDDYRSLIKYMDFNLRLIFDIDNKKTLFISTFALSSWITGQQVLVGLSEIANKYDNVSVFACGMEADEALDVVRRYGEDFDQVIIFSYPLTFKEIADLSEKESVDLSDFNIYTVIGAEGVTYSWSVYYNELLNKEGENVFRIFSSYGTADTGIGIASEQICCHFIKEICNSNPDLLEELTGSKEMPMHFFQYNPIENYFEIKDEELLITKDKHLPLVRYNLHDRAKILKYEELIKVFEKYGYDLRSMTEEYGSKMLKIPFMLLYGRTDGTIILNGANIYINSYMEALQIDEIAHLHTGKFRVMKYEEDDNFQNFVLQLELHDHIESTEEIRNTIRRVVIDFLVENDAGYRKAYHEKYSSDRVCKVVFTQFDNEDTIKHRFK